MPVICWLTLPILTDDSGVRVAKYSDDRRLDSYSIVADDGGTAAMVVARGPKAALADIRAHDDVVDHGTDTPDTEAVTRLNETHGTDRSTAEWTEVHRA